MSLLKLEPSVFIAVPEKSVIGTSDRKELTDNSKITLIKKYNKAEIKENTKKIPDPNVMIPLNMSFSDNKLDEASLDLRTIDSDTYFTISASRKDIDMVEDKLKKELKSNMYIDVFGNENIGIMDSSKLRQKLKESVQDYNAKMQELIEHIEYFNKKTNEDQVPGLMLTGYSLSPYNNVHRGADEKLIQEGRDLWRRILCKNMENVFKEDAEKYISLKKDLIDIDTTFKEIIDELFRKLGKKKLFPNLRKRFEKKNLSIKDIYNKQGLRKLLSRYGVKEYDVREYDNPKSVNLGFGTPFDYLFNRRY